MKILLLAILTASCAGCTMSTLRRETLVQVDSSVDIRLQELTDNLALFADDPTALPVYASIFAGTSQVIDTETFNEATVWQAAKGANGFASQGATPIFQRQIGQNWTLDPVVDPDRLEAIRYCCWWAVYGPQSVGPDGRALLARPDQVPGMPGRHFGVLDQMDHLPLGWIGIGKSGGVPKCVAYSACHGKTAVWIMPGGVRGLADLNLVVQDIARVGINSPTLFSPPFNPAVWVFAANAAHPLPGVNKTVTATVAVDYRGRLAPDTAYLPQRLDSSGTNPDFRSQLAAAGAAKQ